MTNVYFPQETQHKVEILDALTQLNTERIYPLWISGGDYNMISTMEEKKGGRCIINRDGSILKDFIQNNWLIDLPSNNDLYTWNNKRAEPMQIASRLDRFLISDNAVHLGGEFIASILPISGSDHWPITLHWNHPGCNTRRPFRFEAFWLSHPDFYEFNQSIFGNIFKAKETLNQEMKAIQQRMIIEGRSDELAKKEQSIENQILERDLQEETLWRQKYRVRWLKEGEKNTKFFHKTTLQRRMNNQISHINNEQGSKIETHEGIE
eukprot:PITA_26887